MRSYQGLSLPPLLVLSVNQGHACGWLEERLGNTKRKNPTTSYYYCWQDGDQRGKQYVPVRKMAAVQQMLSDRRSVDDILAVLSKNPN